jgi:hypothetical protein
VVPILFNGLAQLTLVVALKLSHLGCGVSACGLRNSCPCIPKRPNLDITRARGMYEWGNTREGWEGGDGVVWSDFRRVRHGCELL